MKIKPSLHQPSRIVKVHMRFGIEEFMNKEELKTEIKRVNEVIRETHNPREYRQNKKYLERLKRKLRQCQRNDI